MTTPALRILAAISAFGALSAAPAHAALIAHENFNTAAGTNNVSGSSGTGSSGFSNNWTTVASSDSVGGNIISPGYTYSGISTAGERAQVHNTDAAATFFYRNLSTPFVVGANSVSTVWVSFIIQGTAATGSLATIGLYSAADPTLSTEGVQIGTVGGNSNYRIASRSMSLGGSGAVVTSTTSANTLSFMVLKYTINTNAGVAESVSLWINPTTFDGTEGSLGSASVSSSSFSNPGYDSIRAISFGSSFVSSGTPTLGIDEIRLGTTLADVTPAAVPEPSSFAALAGLGALGFVGLRRRRRA